MAIKKIKILGTVLELPAKQHCQFSLLSNCKNGPNGLNWQCCLAGSSKRVPGILIFSIAMDADYSMDLISIETHAPQFIGHNTFFLGSVTSLLRIHGHFEPVYLLQVNKNDDEEH
jgi:hypothetical protein